MSNNAAIRNRCINMYMIYYQFANIPSMDEDASSFYKLALHWLGNPALDAQTNTTEYLTGLIKLQRISSKYDIFDFNKETVVVDSNTGEEMINDTVRLDIASTIKSSYIFKFFVYIPPIIYAIMKNASNDMMLGASILKSYTNDINMFTKNIYTILTGTIYIRAIAMLIVNGTTDETKAQIANEAFRVIQDFRNGMAGMATPIRTYVEYMIVNNDITDDTVILCLLYWMVVQWNPTLLDEGNPQDKALIDKLTDEQFDGCTKSKDILTYTLLNTDVYDEDMSAYYSSFQPLIDTVDKLLAKVK